MDRSGKDLTKSQQQALLDRLERFGCETDFRIEFTPFDLPEGWVLVTMGERKGRVINYGISPEGRIAS